MSRSHLISTRDGNIGVMLLVPVATFGIEPISMCVLALADVP